MLLLHSQTTHFLLHLNFCLFKLICLTHEHVVDAGGICGTTRGWIWNFNVLVFYLVVLIGLRSFRGNIWRAIRESLTFTLFVVPMETNLKSLRLANRNADRGCFFISFNSIKTPLFVCNNYVALFTLLKIQNVVVLGRRNLFQIQLFWFCELHFFNRLTIGV